jgi:hypothetical protein
MLAQALEPPVLVPAPVTSGYKYDEPIAARPPAPDGGAKLATALPIRDIAHPGGGVSPYQSGQSVKLPVADAAPSAPTIADASLKLAAARRAAYPEPLVPNQGHSLLLMILLIGLIAFAALFVVGYFVGQFLIK